MLSGERMNDLLAVAFVNKPQGIKGDLKVEVLLDDPANISHFATLYGENNDQFSVDSSYRVGDGYALHLSTINSIEEAMTLKNKYLYAKRADLVKMVGEDKFFIDDIIGKIAIFDDGETVGIIVDVENFGASDIVFIKSRKYTNLSFANIGNVIISVDDKKVVLNKEEFNKVCVYDEQEEA